jgi:hypothetical protein
MGGIMGDTIFTKKNRMNVSENQVHQVIQMILNDKLHYSTSLNYAVNYCLSSKGMSGEELRAQCLYILGNITCWRHPDAKYVRETLKTFSKQN